MPANYQQLAQEIGDQFSPYIQRKKRFDFNKTQTAKRKEKLIELRQQAYLINDKSSFDALIVALESTMRQYEIDENVEAGSIAVFAKATPNGYAATLVSVKAYVEELVLEVDVENISTAELLGKAGANENYSEPPTPSAEMREIDKAIKRTFSK